MFVLNLQTQPHLDNVSQFAKGYEDYLQCPLQVRNVSHLTLNFRAKSSTFHHHLLCYMYNQHIF